MNLESDPHLPVEIRVAHGMGVLFLFLALLGAMSGCGNSTSGPTRQGGGARVGGEIPADLPSGMAASVGLLSSDDEVERARGASLLGALGGEARPAVPFLIDALGDVNWQVRQKSAEALGAIGDDRAVSPLVALLTDRDGDWAVRAAAARSLGALRSPKAIEPLASVLNDMNAHVRHMAVISLGEIGLGTETATAALEMAARSDWDTAVRFAAAESLRRIASARNQAAPSDSEGPRNSDGADEGTGV